MSNTNGTNRAGSTAAAIILLMLTPVAIAGGGRPRPVRRTPALVVGAEYRIPANPDSPWLESVAVAAGSSSGLVVWTESGPKDGESTVRLARLGADGHPIDTTGRLLFENGHYQRHVAIDAIPNPSNAHFLVAWCDVSGAKRQIVAFLLDAGGHPLHPLPLVIADIVGSSQPEVGVTCGNADCLVTWAGDQGEGAFSIGAVTGIRVSPGGPQFIGAPLSLSDKGLGNGIGTSPLNYFLVYAEPKTYGQSGALVAKLLAADGATTELPLTSTQQVEFGTAWVAWNGSEWLILLLDLTTTGGLSQEVRFMRVDGAGQPLGTPGATLLESAGVPLLCPRVPDLFLYDPQNRRVVWDGQYFLIFTQHSITRVTKDGLVGTPLLADDYFPRSYATSVSSAGGGRTVVAYSRDNAVAVRVVEEVP